jgi:hypothetical protein
LDRKLVDYLPGVLRGVREYKTLLGAEETEISWLWDALGNAILDQFAADSTENGVKRRERILNISPKATDSLDARRFRILTRLTEQIPYTMMALKNRLDALCGPEGYSVTLGNGDYTIAVKVALAAKSSFDDVDALLKRTIPANMKIGLSLIYNRYEMLSHYTHGELGMYTHSLLRNEVLI